MKIVDEIELKKYWNFIAGDGEIHGLNTKENYGWSRNVFTDNFGKFLAWVKINEKKNCYMNYSPLVSMINRKNNNVESIKTIGLDIEFSNKEKFEPLERLESMKALILKTIIEPNKIKTYMTCLSGNGFHVFIPIGTKIKDEETLMKLTLRTIIKRIQNRANKMISGKVKISMDDRIDLSGVLRIPETTNTGANFNPKISTIVSDGINVKIKEEVLNILEEIRKKQREVIPKEKSDVLIDVPTTIEEFESHPFVRIWYEKELPEDADKHRTLVFALQILAKESGLDYYKELRFVEEDIMQINNNNFRLNYCSENSDIEDAFKIFMKWCKEYKFIEYYNECVAILNKTGFSVDNFNSEYQKNKDKFLKSSDHLASRVNIEKSAIKRGFTKCVKCGKELTFYSNVGRWECKGCGKYGGIKKWDEDNNPKDNNPKNNQPKDI